MRRTETKESANRRRLRGRVRLLECKYRALSHYSKGTPRCECCGDRHWEFLTLDHVGDDGSKLRRKYPELRSGNVYRWLEKKGYPKGIKVRCFNCNSGRWVNKGTCPHKGKEIEPSSAKMRVLGHYSRGVPRCSCCGERITSFLCIDHKRGGGCRHRSEVVFARSIHKYLLANGLPNGYRVLCYNCNFAARVYGVCIHKSHETSYARLRRLLNAGALKKGGPKPRPLKELLLVKVKKVNGGCWLWTGAKFWDGYGVFAGGRAHKVSYEIFKGKVKKGMFVLHKCDTHACVRPSHLFLGTRKQKTELQLSRGYHSRHRKALGNKIHTYRKKGLQCL